jgi:hypothetical protein
MMFDRKADARYCAEMQAHNRELEAARQERDTLLDEAKQAVTRVLDDIRSCIYCQALVFHQDESAHYQWHIKVKSTSHE